MPDLLSDTARVLAGSRAHDAAVYLLSTVPGLPPIVQTIHLLCIAAVMGSVVMLSLRVLGLALPSQRLDEMVQRLAPWMWWALPLLLVSGLMFVLARPHRYFSNPVFGYKFALLMAALALTVLLQRLVAHTSDIASLSAVHRVRVQAIAAVSLVLWIGVVLAGRWIAYADYLFPPE